MFLHTPSFFSGAAAGATCTRWPLVTGSDDGMDNEAPSALQLSTAVSCNSKAVAAAALLLLPLPLLQVLLQVQVQVPAAPAGPWMPGSDDGVDNEAPASCNINSQMAAAAAAAVGSCCPCWSLDARQ